MAIDSAEKRRSISGIQHFLIPGVTPNASKDQEWRQESGWSYSGILAGAASPFAVASDFIQFFVNIAMAKAFGTNITRSKGFQVER